MNNLENLVHLSKEDIDKIYKYYWLYIRTCIEDLPLKKDLSKEDFSKLRTNFNIPSIGKLTCSYDKYKVLHNNYEDSKNK